MRVGLVWALILVLPEMCSADVLVTGSGLDEIGFHWTLSFDITPPVTDFVNEPVSNASFLINGAPLVGPVTSVQFYPAVAGGLIQVNFPGFEVVDLFGADITSLTPGIYPMFNIYGGPAGLVGGDQLTGTVVVGGSAVPEPSTIALLSLGALVLALTELRRRHQPFLC